MNKKRKTINYDKMTADKIYFREMCLQYLPIVKNIIVPPLKYKLENEAVFIDFRWFPHMEFLILNTVLKLPNWSHTIVCGNKNIDNIKKCTSKIKNIRIIALNINDCTLEQYSEMLLTTNFWEMFYGEKIKVIKTTIETPNIDVPEDVEKVLRLLQ